MNHRMNAKLKLVSFNFVDLSRYSNMLQDLHKKANAGREVLEDHGFEEHDFRDNSEQLLSEVQSDIPPGSKHVVLYNVVRKTFKELVHLCVLEKYGLAKS